MPVPVMTIVGSVRKDLALSARNVADQLGITHGYLQQLEEFEYVLEPSYITQHKKPLEISIKEFLESNLPKIKPIIRNNIQAITSKLYIAMKNDYIFHSISLNNLQDVYISNSNRSVYGPLFGSIMDHYFARDNDNILLRSTGDNYLDYFLNYIMTRFWGHKAAQRRRHTRATGILYIPFDYDNHDSKYIGYFEGSNDPRDVFTLNLYSARRSYLPFLFLYVITNRLCFNFNVDNIPDISNKALEKHAPTQCSVVSDSCSAPSKCCNHISFISPGRKEIDFFYRPDGAGLFTHYCVRDS